MTDLADMIVRWELGISEAGDEAELARLLHDPAARRIFVRQARIATLLATAPAARARPHAPPPRPQRVTARPRRTPVPRGRQALIWAAAAAVIAIGVLSIPTLRAKPPGLPLSSPAVARVAAADSGAQIIGDDGRQRSAQAGATLFAGDLLIAGGGRAELALTDDAAELTLTAGGRLRLPTQRSHREFALIEGRMQAQVRPRPIDSPFVVTTPTARVEVVGTSFTVAAQPAATRLHVSSGTVRLVGSDAQLLVEAGLSALSADGITGFAPGGADADTSIPGAAQVVWRADPMAIAGWRAVLEDPIDGGPAWRAVPAEAGNTWVTTEVRTPIARSGWAVGPRTQLRFRYQIEDLPVDGYLEVHLKPADETNFALRITPEAGRGWHETTVPLAGFRHLMQPQRVPEPGERIHGATWQVPAPAPGAPPRARFWIRDVVAFEAP